MCGRACDNEKVSPRPAPATKPCVHRLKPPPAGQGFPACRSPKFVHRKNFGGSPSSLKAKATDTAFRFPLKSQYRLPIKIYLGGLVSALISCLVSDGAETSADDLRRRLHRHKRIRVNLINLLLQPHRFNPLARRENHRGLGKAGQGHPRHQCDEIYL